MARNYSDLTLKQLFLTSGHYCAFPECASAIVEFTDAGPVVLGEIAHIDTDYIRVSAPGPYASAGLLLVPVERPADVPAALGWTGPLNHGLGPAQLSVILRSWEDRFGATLVALDFDSLELSVARPPDEEAECAAAAKEHVLTAPDLVAESGLSEYISALCDQDAWFLWWD